MNPKSSEEMKEAEAEGEDSDDSLDGSNFLGDQNPQSQEGAEMDIELDQVESIFNDGLKLYCFEYRRFKSEVEELKEQLNNANKGQDLGPIIRELGLPEEADVSVVVTKLKELNGQKQQNENQLSEAREDLEGKVTNLEEENDLLKA